MQHTALPSGVMGLLQHVPQHRLPPQALEQPGSALLGAFTRAMCPSYATAPCKCSMRHSSRMLQCPKLCFTDRFFYTP